MAALVGGDGNGGAAKGYAGYYAGVVNGGYSCVGAAPFYRLVAGVGGLYGGRGRGRAAYPYPQLLGANGYAGGGYPRYNTEERTVQSRP